GGGVHVPGRPAGRDPPVWESTPGRVEPDVPRGGGGCPAGDHMPQYSQLPHEVEPSSRSCANAESCVPAGTSTLVGSLGSVRSTSARPEYSRSSSAEAGTCGFWYDHVRFSIGSGTVPPSLGYISRSLTNSRAKISESALPSPGGSAAFSFHWLTRLELVNEPVSSAKQVLGSRNTSVWICLGSTSFSGPKFFQNSEVSVSSGSMTTRYFSFAIAALSFFLLGSAASGLKPWQRKPFILPRCISSNMCRMSYARSRFGSQL